MNEANHHDLGCAALTSSLGEHPAGTAPTDETWLLMELSRPWPQAINQHRDLLGRTYPGVRIVAIEPPDGARGDEHADVILYRRPPGLFLSFERYSATVNPSELAGLAEGVAAGDLGPLSLDPGRDVLVCTHEARDICCGQRGPALLASLPPTEASLWRASHLGGHRFAPTMVDFPSGMAWANLSPTVAVGAIEHTLGSEQINDHLRGCVAFTSREAQAADAAAIARHGWAWVEAGRGAVADPPEDGVTEVRLTSGSRTETYRVRPGRTLPVPLCQQPLERSQKNAVELIVD